MSELQDVKKNPHTYWLGEVVSIHEIAEFAFVQYKERAFSPRGHGEETGEYHYSIFIHGKSIGQGATSLESAMAHAIAYKFDGCNSQAAYYFMRMIGNEPHKDYTKMLPKE